MTTVTTQPGTAAAAVPAALTPWGAQAVFRATLDVLARPGTVRRLPSAADEPLAGHVPAALLPLLALADLSTPACVVDAAGGAARADGVVGDYRADEAPVADGEVGLDGGGYGRIGWDEIVRVATNAPRTALGDARLVAALRPLTADELAGLRTGTAGAPEEGALACLAVAGIAIVDGVDGGPDPGVDGGPHMDGTRTDGTHADGTHADGTHADSADADSADADSADADRAGLDEADRGAGVGRRGADGDGAEADSAHADGTHKANAARTEADLAESDGARRLRLRLSGPGVPGMRAIVVTGLPAGFATARRRLVAGFPAGADLLLITPDGAMTGLPRTTTVHEEAD